MSSFLYFFPGRPSIRASEYESFGLKPSLGQAEAHVSCELTGPGKRSGCMIRAGSSPVAEAQYSPDDQDWIECDGGKFWLGCEKSSRPGPDDLIRVDDCGGYSVLLGDGNRWNIPVARMDPDGEDLSTLDKSIGMDRDGRLTMKPMSRYDALIDYASTAWDMFVHNHDAEAVEAPIADEAFKFDAAVSALSSNYHVTKWEVSLLRLITLSSQVHILSAICDWPTYMRRVSERQKKTASDSMSDGSSTADGDED